MTTKFWLAAVTLEATAPLTIATGGGDDLRDSTCVTDATGLPALPGSSVAGALRARWSEASRDDVFGHRSDTKDAHRSRLWVGWGSAHGADDVPAPFLRLQPSADPVLELLKLGVTRDHVRISCFGVADGNGKFDETLVPRGARFTMELRLDDPTPGEVQELLNILGDADFRLGGRTRKGFGTVSVQRVHAEAFNLTQESDRARWVKVSREASLGKRQAAMPAIEQKTKGKAQSTEHLRFRLRLKPEGGWRVGQGEATEAHRIPSAPGEDARYAGLVPVRERAIRWRGSRGEVIDHEYLPGSSVKGGLRHRTAYHLRCLQAAWWDDQTQSALSSAGATHAVADGTERLFGTTRSDGSNEDVAGRVFVSDVLVASPTAELQQHVALDRFTGGPISGCLFTEALLWGGEVKLDISVNAEGLKTDDPLLKAFTAAVKDLQRGRLALGAAGSRGHGYFREVENG